MIYQINTKRFSHILLQLFRRAHRKIMIITDCSPIFILFQSISYQYHMQSNDNPFPCVIASQ